MRYFVLALMCCMVYVTKTFAVSTSIVQSPPSVNDEPFTITVNITGATAGLNYLRADLYLPETKNYFGETDNSQYWYGGSDGRLYFPVTIESGTPLIATFSARLGSPSTTDYPGPGLYKLRIRRYTSSGNQGSEDPQSVDINLTKAYPSPTPTPTPTPSPSTLPSVSPSSTTTSPSPTPPTTPASSKLPTLSPSPHHKPETFSIESGTVSGASTIDLSGFGLTSPTPSKETEENLEANSLSLNKDRVKLSITVGSGLILISLASYLWYRKRMKGIIT